MSSQALTCINCNIKFADANFHREHYKTDWHRYNLKRRIAALPPVTADEFQNRVVQMRNENSAAIEDKQTQLYCNPCRKQFSSTSSHDNHLNSKKHKENLAKFNDINGESKAVTTKSLIQPKEKPMVFEDDEIEEVILKFLLSKNSSNKEYLHTPSPTFQYSFGKLIAAQKAFLF